MENRRKGDRRNTDRRIDTRRAEDTTHFITPEMNRAHEEWSIIKDEIVKVALTASRTTDYIKHVMAIDELENSLYPIVEMKRDVLGMLTYNREVV